MKTISILLFSLLLCSVALAAGPPGKSEQIELQGKKFARVDDRWYVESSPEQWFGVMPDVVTVKFKKAAAQKAKTNFFNAQRVAPIRTNRLGAVDITVPAGMDPVTFVAQLQKSGLFEYAEVNTFGRWEYIPDDTLFTDQWGLDNTGQTGGTADADVDAPEAWDIADALPDVAVAVLDSGTDYDHEDLECNIWVNPGEDLDNDGVVMDDPDDINGLDDDGNGYIDDLIGWDFVAPDYDPDPSNWHGTHVAGIIGACGDNATGIIGVAGGTGGATGAKMMVLLVGNNAPVSSIMDDAIIYAADNGARIIALSLSVGQSTAIDDALEYAYDTMGVLIVNSTGNENTAVGYPASNAYAMAVGATDDDDVRAESPPLTWGSNFGPEVEVVAPGVTIMSTTLADTYGNASGTSMASPHVSGTAALMFSADPSATNQDVRDCIIATAEDEVGDPDEDIAGRDDFYGFGRLNTAAALACITGNSLPVCDANGPYTAECSMDTILNGSGSSDPDGDAMTYDWVGPFASSPTSGVTPTVVFPAPTGLKSVDLMVTDTFGYSDSCSAPVNVQDTTAPSITAPADINIQHVKPLPNVVTLGSPITSDACDVTLTVTNDALPAFPLGSTLVTWTATDDAGNSAQAVQTVTLLNTAPVADNQSPVFIEDSVANVITLTASDINNDAPLVYGDITLSVPFYGSLGGSPPNMTYTPAADYFGSDDSFTFTATDEHGAISAPATVSITVTPVNDPPVISISRATATVQYSDTIGTVTITATDVDDDPLALSSEYTDNGGAPIAGLPSALGTLPLLDADACTAVPNDTASDGTSCSWDLTGQMLEDAGDYDITLTVTDGGGGTATIESDSGVTEIIVNPEDATVNFDLANEVAVQVDGDGSDSSLPFSLKVFIDETEPDIATFIARHGDLSLAVPHMVLTPIGPGGPESPDSCDTSVPGTGYDQVMTYTCYFSGVPVNTYSVDVNVDGGYYIGENDDVFTVFDPSLGFTTGGGWFYWPGTNDKTNFGYVMKYNKKQTNLQGSLLLIRHVEGSTTGEKWRIKSNALEGLSIGSDPDFGWAAFSGKATYRSPTEENEGNNEFTVYLEDHGVPGKGVDQVWVQTRDKQDDVRPDLSMPEPGAGNTETIEGGNIFVPHTSKGRGKK